VFERLEPAEREQTVAALERLSEILEEQL
jgi:hypothetical protein